MHSKKYTISEVANILDYETHVLRFYENEFEIEVPRNKSNRRQYTNKEIEIFQYVKSLKDQGYNNNQIKQILKSPTLEENEDSTTLSLQDKNALTRIDSNEVAIREVAMHLETLNDSLFSNFSRINENIQSLSTTISELKNEHFMEEKEVLISENEKLKMRLKEKAYELVDLKEKYSRLEQKKFVFKKLFRSY